MQEQTEYTVISKKTTNWGKALENKIFRNKLLIGVISLAVILTLFPHFFNFIESRKGAVLNDVLLNVIKPMDVSVPLFIIIWSMTLFFLIRCFSQPGIFIQGIYCLCILCLTRMLTIYLVELDPPSTYIAIKDPLTSITYGGKDVFMTKDLFFSGHTSNMLMLALCLQKKTDRWIGFAAAIAVGILVLVQHVHYTIDVVAAFVITAFVVTLGKKLATY